MYHERFHRWTAGSCLGLRINLRKAKVRIQDSFSLKEDVRRLDITVPSFRLLVDVMQRVGQASHDPRQESVPSTANLLYLSNSRAFFFGEILVEVTMGDGLRDDVGPISLGIASQNPNTVVVFQRAKNLDFVIYPPRRLFVTGSVQVLNRDLFTGFAASHFLNVLGKETQRFQWHSAFDFLKLGPETVMLRCPFRWGLGLAVIPLFRSRREEIVVRHRKFD